MEQTEQEWQGQDEPVFAENPLADSLPEWEPEWQEASPRRHYWIWSLAGALAFLGVVACLVLLAVAGMSDGLEDRAREALRQAEEHYALGQAHLEAQEYELAIAEFELALRFNAGHEQARQMLAAAKATAEVQATPTSEARLSAAAQLYQEVQALYADGIWDAAATELERLRGLDPTYEEAHVTAMLAEVYVQQGLKAVEDDDLARALNRFDKALELVPGHTVAQDQTNWANLYIAALSYWNRDWPATIQAFTGLYALVPDYKDVPQRLYEAHQLYADALAADGAWCAAASQYAAASQVLSRAETLTLLTEATEQCRRAMVTPTPESETASTPQPGGATGSASVRGRIAFSTYVPTTQSYDLYELDLRTGVARLVLSGGSQPSYGPLGQELAFYNHDPNMLGVGVVNLAGTEVRNVSANVEDSFPSWSPSGEQIVFASSKHGDRGWRVYVISPEEIHGQGEEWGFGRTPAWSPDSQQVAYNGCDARGQNCGLYLMDAGGDNPRVLTRWANDTMPAWSPDGRQVAFASDRDGSWDLYVVDVSDGEVRQLTDDDALNSAPAWSPSGRQLAFLSNRDEGSWSIYLFDLGTRQIARLAPVSDTYPDWAAQRLSWTR